MKMFPSDWWRHFDYPMFLAGQPAQPAARQNRMSMTDLVLNRTFLLLPFCVILVGDEPTADNLYLVLFLGQLYA